MPYMNMLSNITKKGKYGSGPAIMGATGENLFFLISQPRSGSTLLQRILAGNSEIATTSEPWIALHPISALQGDAIDPNYDANQASEALLEFLHSSGADISFYKKQITNFLLRFYDQAVAYQNKRYFLDKTPRYYYIVDHLHELFPDAKFIILLRNPFAVLHSVLKTWVKDDYSLLINNFDDLIVAPHNISAFLQKKPPNCHVVHYEKLVADPHKTMKHLCGFLDVTYSDGMIDYGNRNDPKWRYGDQVGIKKSVRPDVASAHKWKNGFNESRDQLLACSYLDSLGERLIEDLGYDLSDIKKSINVSPSDSGRENPSWSVLCDIIKSISSVKDVRRVVFRSLLENGYFTSRTATGKVDWNDYVKNIVTAHIRFKEKNLLGKINELQNINAELALEAKRLNKNIARMENTLSWRLTALFRESKLLTAMAKKIHLK